MRIICAPDKFKGSLSAPAAAQAMARGIRRVHPEAQIDLCPVADGGDGFVDAMAVAMHAGPQASSVQGPLGHPVQAKWAMASVNPGGQGQELTAILEMAAASGLVLVPDKERNPMLSSTYGTGQLIKSALDCGARHILLGIGGSATNDGGAGCAQALGLRFFDSQDRSIDRPITGGMLGAIARLDASAVDSRLKETKIEVACDVTNPLTGRNGAAYVYSPQKGATPAQVEELDAGLQHLAELIRRDLHCDIETLPGAGAAGGLGGGLVAFLGATLRPGIDLVLDAVDFSKRVQGCTLCLTGEGRIDGQTANGKTIAGVAQRAKAAGVPTMALVGSAGEGAEKTLEYLKSYHMIGEGLSVEESMRRAGELLERAAFGIVSSVR